MPWKQTNNMCERYRFIQDLETGLHSIAQLARKFGISRPTAYKWVERYEQGGVEALADQSRAPRSHPNQTPEDVEQLVVDYRLKHPTWGPKKIGELLTTTHPGLEIPARSTIGAILKREGLVTPRRRRRLSPPPPPGELKYPDACNKLWCVDFKGWFRTKDGARCEPLTMTDAHSRMILCCRAFTTTAFTPKLKAALVASFREYGLPERIRSDNGAPFAHSSGMGLTRLSVWWMRLGIELERIEPGKPQQNGRHERMHRTLKAETASPPEANLRAQQRRFNAWVSEFNEERPHEAHGQRPPASVHTFSARAYPRRLPELDYDSGMAKRKVCKGGKIGLHGAFYFVCEALAGEWLGLRQTDELSWEVYFGRLKLGVLDEKTCRFVRAL